MTTDTDDGDDEFGLLHENAEEWGLPWTNVAPHAPARVEVDVGDGQRLSTIKWGTADTELVFLHGGGQNAHTWDTVVLALGRPALAVDLPGHGHSDRRPDRDYGPWRNAEVVAVAVRELAPNAAAVVGMSLGGATTIRMASQWPELCRAVVIVDVTPQVTAPGRELTVEQRGSVALVSGPPTYDSFEAMVDATVVLSPNRPRSAIARGVRHNAYALPDGRWTWRYDLFGDSERRERLDFTSLWDDVVRLSMAVMFVRGGSSPFVLDEDVTEWRRRLPATRVEVVAGAGHAVQSDQPLVLAHLIEEFVFG